MPCFCAGQTARMDGLFIDGHRSAQCVKRQLRYAGAISRSNSQCRARLYVDMGHRICSAADADALRSAALYNGVALLIAVAMFGLARKGAKRWLHVGVVIQPSEIMKIAVPMMLAWYYHQRAGLIRTHDHLIALLLLMAPVGLIARQPDLGTAILVFSSGFFVSYLAGLSFRWIVPVFLAFALAVGALITFETKICQPD